MKYLREYEGFFSNIKRRLFSSNVYYRWYYQEAEELESLNFYRISEKDYNSEPYYFKPNVTDSIKEIIVIKYYDIGSATSSTDIETVFYRAEVKKNKRTIKKNFDSFEEMIEFVKKHIPEVEIDTKKYNL